MTQVQIPLTLRRRSTDWSEAESLQKLIDLREGHPFWDNPLLKACQTGALTQEDFKFIFGQYYFYSKNFTRYLSGLMATCENDLLRSRLSENLWEEGGEREPSKRHAEIFRRFLSEGLKIQVETLTPIEATELFTREYLDFCLHSHPCESSAFLSFGTEAIVPRLYTIIIEGLLKAGVEEKHLEFFQIHIECDDAHAATLEDIAKSYSHLPHWYSMCERSLIHALDIRDRFFSSLYRHLQYQRIESKIQKIQTRVSLAVDQPTDQSPLFLPLTRGKELYQNTIERLNIDFTVDRIPYNCEVLDPRIVRIPPGKFNELHRHAHETVFYFIQGSGSVVINKTEIQVKAGDVAFVPRWTLHQSRNSGEEEMIILAVTDYGLTGQVFIGNYYRTTRMKGESQEESQALQTT